MIENNKFEKSFGPMGSFAGAILFITGAILTYFHLTAIILILIGAFVGFSSTSTLIDYKKKRIKFSNNLFGIIRLGHWLIIEPTMKVGIKENKITWRGYSQGNRSFDIVNDDYRIMLYDSGNKEIMPMKKTSTMDLAKTELETIGGKLGLSLC
jgi:hypothetical protein